MNYLWTMMNLVLSRIFLLAYFGPFVGATCLFLLLLFLGFPFAKDFVFYGIGLAAFSLMGIFYSYYHRSKDGLRFVFGYFQGMIMLGFSWNFAALLFVNSSETKQKIIGISLLMLATIFATLLDSYFLSAEIDKLFEKADTSD